MNAISPKDNRLLALIILAFPGVSFADESLKNRLLSEAPKSWAALEAFGAQLEGAFTGAEVDLKFSDGFERPKMNVRCQFVTHGKWALVKTRGQPMGMNRPLDVDWVKAVNSRYAFSLNRDSESSPYKVDWIGLPTEAADTADGIYKSIYAPWWYAKVWFESPGFVLLNVSPTPKNDREHVRLEFEYSPPANASEREKRTGRSHGWIVLDPSNYWSVQEYETSKESVKVSGSLEYGGAIDAFPVLRRRTHMIRNNNGSQSKEVWEVQRIRRRAAPESEFTLSAFGWQEPAEGQSVEHASNAWLWYILTLILISVVAVGLRWYQRHYFRMSAI